MASAVEMGVKGRFWQGGFGAGAGAMWRTCTGSMAVEVDTFLHESDAFEKVLIQALATWVDKAEWRPGLRMLSSCFHGKRVPQVTLADYVRRIMRYAGCSPVCYSVAICYMRRLASGSDDMVPTWFNVHRILLACVLLAVKTSEDVHFDNVHFAKVGGLSLPELNKLELDVLHRLQFCTHVSIDEVIAAEAAILEDAKAVVTTPLVTPPVAPNLMANPEPRVAQPSERAAKPMIGRESKSDSVWIVVQ